MGLKKLLDLSKFSAAKYIRGINIPPQPTVPTMPPVQQIKKKENEKDRT